MASDLLNMSEQIFLIYLEKSDCDTVSDLIQSIGFKPVDAEHLLGTLATDISGRDPASLNFDERSNLLKLIKKAIRNDVQLPAQNKLPRKSPETDLD